LSSFTFHGPYPVVLSARGLLVEPGDTVTDLDAPPGPDWAPAGAPPPTELPAPPPPTDTPAADAAAEED